MLELGAFRSLAWLTLVVAVIIATDALLLGSVLLAEYAVIGGALAWAILFAIALVVGRLVAAAATPDKPEK
jgi:hypothetical protein